MKIGYIRQSARFSEKMQRAALEAEAVKVVYVEGRSEGIIDIVRSVRAKDEVWVTSLDRLAPTRKTLRMMVDAIHERGGVIVEASTKRRSNRAKDLADMIFDAADVLAGDRKTHTPAKAREYGKKGGRPRFERMSKEQAEKHWFDMRNPSIDAALEKMEGWTMRMAYREFGPSGRAAGRPKKA